MSDFQIINSSGKGDLLFNVLTNGKRVKLPNGKTVQSVSPGTDFLNSLLGVSPFATQGDGEFNYKDDSGKPVNGMEGNNSVVSGAASSAAGWIGDWLIRGTVIVLGFIFVAIGLSMFKNPVIETVKSVVK